MRYSPKINIVLLDSLIDESNLTGKELSVQLGVSSATWRRWKVDYLKMPVDALVILCCLLEVDVKDVLWFKNKGSRENVLTKREIQMIRKDNMSSREAICEFFNITDWYLSQIKSRGDIYLIKYSCIPPRSIREMT